MAVGLIDLSQNQKLLGEFNFSVLPRKGEWIEVLLGDEAYIFEVLIVVHSTDDHVEIYVKRLGALQDLLESQFGDLSQSSLKSMGEIVVSPCSKIIEANRLPTKELVLVKFAFLPSIVIPII